MGRMLNEQLTPRQFEMISGIRSVVGGEWSLHTKDAEHE